MHTKLIYALLALAVLIGAFGYLYTHQSVLGSLGAPGVVRVATSTAFYSIEAAYPEESRDTTGVMQEYVSGLVTARTHDWKEGGEVWQAEQDIQKDFPDRPAMQYQMTIAYRVARAPKLDIVSYVFEHYEFTGGAHGGTDLATFAFGPSGVLPLDALIDFERGNDIALSRLLAQKLVTQLGENSSPETIDEGLGLAYLRPDGSFDQKKCGCDGFFFPSNFQHFYITDTGITFIMGQYQVAAYAYGMPEVAFTWEELEPFLKKANTQ